MVSWLTVKEDDDDEPSFDDQGRPSFKRWPFLQNGEPNPEYLKTFYDLLASIEGHVFCDGIELHPTQFEVDFWTPFDSGPSVRVTDLRIGNVPADEVEFSIDNVRIRTFPLP